MDKVLIYRYFGGLPELLRAWGESGRFWPRVADLLGPEPQALLDLPAAERWARFFEHFIDELRRRPLTLEVLAAELVERNELTAILEAEREAWGEEAMRVLGGTELAARPHLQARHTAAGGRLAVPAAALAPHPRLRRRRPAQRRRLGAAEAVDPDAGAGRLRTVCRIDGPT